MRTVTGHPPVCSIIWDESQTLVYPTWSALEQYLTFEEKKLAELVCQTTGRTVGRRVKKETKPIHQVIRNDDGLEACQTYAGIWWRLVGWLRGQGVPFRFHDTRQPFPAPQFDRMFGFRFSQRELLVSALERDMSGLLCAPTRWGKSTLIKNTLRAFTDIRTVVLMPGEDLLSQQVQDLKDSLPGRKITQVGGTHGCKTQGPDITVCLMDDVALARLDHQDTQLVLIDEPHALVTDCQLDSYNCFTRARKIGFGATLTGRFDNRDILIEAVIGPVLAERTYRDAVREGAICEVLVLALRVPITEPLPDNRLSAYYQALYTNELMAKHMCYISNHLIPSEWQTLFFISNEKQAKFYQNRMPGTHVAMAKLMKVRERREMLEQMRSGEIKRCLASNIYSTGVTFSDLRCVVNLAGGGGNLLSIQKPGRVAEIRPGKRCGVVMDVIFTDETGRKPSGGTRALVGESFNRLRTYREKGYDVRVVDSYEELEKLFRELCI